MSRALTIYTRRDKAEGPTPEVERVMAEQGCSEPVARNLLKYAKLGIGPLAGVGASRDADRRPFREETSREREMRRNMPPKLDPKVAAALAEQRLREKEEQEEKELEEKRKQDVARRRVGLSRLGPVLAREDDPSRPAAFLMPGRAEEEAGDQDDKKSRPRHGLAPLGPVLARQEEVDPLLNAPPPPPPPEPQGEPPEDDNDNAGVALGTHRTRSAERKRAQAQQEEARRGKKKKRRRGKDEKSGDSDAPQNEGAHAKKATLERPQEVKRGVENAARQEKARSPSASPAHDAGRGAGSSGGLMSEAQVLAMMNKEGKTKRGSVRAMSRIQREMQEWETRKQQNPEFWKAPQFALCYSAETGNKRSAY